MKHKKLVYLAVVLLLVLGVALVQASGPTGTISAGRDTGAQNVSRAGSFSLPRLFGHEPAFGETEKAYIADTAHLYNLEGVGADGTGNLWVTETLGARVLKYSGNGAFLMPIGTAGRVWLADNMLDSSGVYKATIGVTAVPTSIGLSTKTVNTPTASPGDPLTYTIALSNSDVVSITNVYVTDTLPISITYTINSLTATHGSYAYSNGVITWTGTLDAGGSVTITFGAKVNQGVILGSSIVNSAIISGGGEVITRSATVDLSLARVFLPVIARNYCPDFFDDFSNPASGWDVGEDSFVRAEYLSGEFRILSKQAGYFYLFQAPTCDRQNYTVEADARWAGAPGESYGLIFGVTGDYDRLYLFDVNTDLQMFRLLRLDGDIVSTIVPPTYSPAIQGGTTSNHLKVIRNNDQITLAVNGIVLGTWSDGSITGLTGAGLVSSPYDSNPISDARFDNFSAASYPPASVTSCATLHQTLFDSFSMVSPTPVPYLYNYTWSVGGEMDPDFVVWGQSYACISGNTLIYEQGLTSGNPGGGMYLYNTQTFLVTMAGPNVTVSGNYEISAQFNVFKSKDNARYGIIFGAATDAFSRSGLEPRFNANANYYAFALQFPSPPNGNRPADFQLELCNTGNGTNCTKLVDRTPIPSGANADGVWDTLKVRRQGNQITIFVNNVQLATVSDGTLTGTREFGVYIRSQNVNGTGSPLEVDWDNYTVTQLP